MDNTLLQKYRFGFFFGKLFLYKDHLEIKGILNKKIIPSHKISNVSINKLTSRMTIETSGGEKTMIPFTIFTDWSKIDEIQSNISNLAHS